MSKMANGKAVGVDMLHDNTLKAAIRQSLPLKTKIAQVFERWINGEQIPEYITTAKTFVLSKEKSQFPKQGNVRIISVLSSMMKLYELIILKHLE